MSGLTENEILAKHEQSLKEAHRACQMLGKNADPDYIAPRGHLYGQLKRACMALEGSARQLAAFREDARWLKLGIFYAMVQRKNQAAFVGQRWGYFEKLQQLFTDGTARMNELRHAKTGKRGPILPARPSEFLLVPDHRVPWPNRGILQ